MINLEIVGSISFDNRSLDVYSSLDVPLFKASDIASMINYSEGNTWKLLELCEEDEKLKLPIVVAGQRRPTNFVTENGLYNILSQSKKPVARKWRRIIHDELIKIRKENQLNISEQFDQWDSKLDTIFIDPNTGIMMQSVTVEGGDVIQIPYREEN